MIYKEVKVCINKKNVKGQTPLILAMTTGNKRISLLLLEYPFLDPNICDNSSMTAIHYDIIEGDMEIIIKLLRHPKIKLNVCDRYSRTPFWYAVKNGDFDAIKLLLRSRDNIYIGDERYYYNNEECICCSINKLKSTEIKNLIKEYTYRKCKVRKRLLEELGYPRQYVIYIFLMNVMISDEYWKICERCVIHNYMIKLGILNKLNKQIRFFKIMRKLNVDLRSVRPEAEQNVRSCCL